MSNQTRPSLFYKGVSNDDLRRCPCVSYIIHIQARIQDSEGGGGVVQEFQERIQIVAGPWANQQATKKLQTAVGGGGVRSPKKPPVSTPDIIMILKVYGKNHF